MADTKISALGAIPALAGADVLPIVDDTDTTTKKVSITQLDGRYQVVTGITKTADQSVTSSTTLVDDNEIVFAVGADETWHIRIALLYSAASGTPGLKAGVTAPTGAACNIAVQGNTRGSDGLLDAVAYGSGTGSASVAAVNVDVDSAVSAASFFTVDIVVLNSSTAGNVTFQFAQKTSSLTSITVKAGTTAIGTRTNF